MATRVAFLTLKQRLIRPSIICFTLEMQGNKAIWYSIKKVKTYNYTIYN